MNFRFLNIPVHIHPTFWLFLLFFTNLWRDPSIESVIWGVVFALSLLVHEYGHALTALFFGAKPSITLWVFGGYTEYNSRRMTPLQSFIITLNGPLFEAVLIVLAYALLKIEAFENYPYIRYFLIVTMRLNIVWCLLNLIPLVPLDGGHLARYLLEKKWGDAGCKASLIIGLISVVLIAPYLYYVGFFFFGTLLLVYGFQNFQILQGAQPSSGATSAFSFYLNGIETMNTHEPKKAKALFKKGLKSKDAHIRHSAIESLAKIYLQENEQQKAYDLLLKADPQLLKEGKCLLCKLAFERKNDELVCQYSREIYEIDPSFDHALLNSWAFARLGQPTLAGGWLMTASQFGESERETARELLSSQLYDSVRDSDAFKQQVKDL